MKCIPHSHLLLMNLFQKLHLLSRSGSGNLMSILPLLFKLKMPMMFTELSMGIEEFDDHVDLVGEESDG
jgi:hypothetical protein